MLSIGLRLSTEFCYGSISLFITVLHNVFLLYHIEMFVSVFKIDKTSFWIGEGIFLLWNSVNDPLFGWFGDQNNATKVKNDSEDFETLNSDDSVDRKDQQLRLDATSGDYYGDRHDKCTGVSPAIIIKRSKAIAFCGPLMAVCFTAFWFDWNMPSIQFAICLCSYDAFLTIVDLHQSALLADLSLTTENRTKMNSYESIFSIFGSVSVFLSYYFWENINLGSFQVFCVLLAVFSAVGLYTMSTLLRHSYIRNHSARSEFSWEREAKTRNSLPKPQQMTLKIFLRQLLAHKNFQMFTIINIIQVGSLKYLSVSVCHFHYLVCQFVQLMIS